MDISHYVAVHGVSLVFANVFAQQLGLPIPAEPTLVVAGALAARGLVSPFEVIAATVLATALADTVWFLVGRRYERKVATLFSWSKRGESAQRESRFGRWGVRALLLARFLPGAVQLIVPLAGARHVRMASFVFYDLTGIVLWAALPVTGGMLFHRQTEMILRALAGRALWFGVAALVVAAVVVLWRRRVGSSR